MSAPPITIPGTEVHTLHSDIVGDDYEISVIQPPPGFASGPVPEVYVLDASFLAPTAAAASRLLTVGGEIPPVLVVAIGYPVGNDPVAIQRFRHRDLTHKHIDELADSLAAVFGIQAAELELGGAHSFLRFLTEELRPWTAARFDVTGDSTLVGVSSAGLFATWTLLHHPSAFNRYVIGTPYVSFEQGSSRAWVDDYAAKHSDLDATVFLVAGGEEHLPGPYPTPAATLAEAHGADSAITGEIGDALQACRFPNLRLATRIRPEETHWTLPVGALLPQGLRYVFAKDGQR